MSERVGPLESHTLGDRAELVSVETTPGMPIELMRTSYRTQVFPKHTHDFLTIGLMLRGRGRLWIGGEHHETQRGDIVIIPAGEVHTGSVAPRAAVLSYFAAHVPLGVMDAATDAHCDIASPVVHDRSIAAQLARVERAMRARDGREADDALTAAIGLLVVDHATPARSRDEPYGAGEPRLVHIARELLDDCYNDNSQTSLHALAARTGVTTFHLVRLFTRTIGLSPHQYLVQTRIRHATALLARGIPCSRVAAMTGFADQSHLTTQFKRYLGITPVSYQRCLASR